MAYIPNRDDPSRRCRRMTNCAATCLTTKYNPILNWLKDRQAPAGYSSMR